MIRIICLMLVFFTVFRMYSQNTANRNSVLFKSTITSIGGKNSTIIDGKYRITQCTGQSGIIGTRKSNLLMVQQGFITNTINFRINNLEKDVFEEKLDLTISPNPFVDHIKIDFSKRTIYDVEVQIFDLNGRFIFSEKYQPTESIVVPLTNLANAMYIVLVTSGSDKFTKKIVKQ